MKLFNPPTYSQVKSWWKWEFNKLMGRGWSELFRLLGLLAVAAVFTVLGEVHGLEAVNPIVVGFSVLLLLHPFLKAGELFCRHEVPRRWYTCPSFPYLFAFNGLLSEFLTNLVGLVAFAVILSVTGFEFGFLLSPLFWVVLVLLLPGVLGWGLIIQSLRLITGSGPALRHGLSRCVELLGGVFFAPGLLPLWLFPLHYVIPHSYLTWLGRSITGAAEVGLGYLAAGFAAGLGIFLVGMFIFFLVLDDYIQSGRAFRQ